MEEYSRSLSAVRLPAEAVLRDVAASLDAAFDHCATLSRGAQISLPEAAVQIAVERVWKAMRCRRQV
jgi:hypothetical protein